MTPLEPGTFSSLWYLSGAVTFVVICSTFGLTRLQLSMVGNLWRERLQKPTTRIRLGYRTAQAAALAAGGLLYLHAAAHLYLVARHTGWWLR